MGLSAALVLGAGSFVVAQGNKADPAAQKTEAIDFRKLKEWLPAELNGMKRSEANGERNKLGEITISQARATYGKGDDEKTPRIELEVVDYGGMNQMAQGLAMAWTAAEIDRESDDGYEKTIKIKNNPGMETWQKEGSHGEIQLLVGKRYILTLRTDNIPAEQFKKVAESLALEKLAELK
jgi:hypothetical protein